MSVTMQESFAGIRVIKSFAGEEHQEKVFRRSNQKQFSHLMRMVNGSYRTTGRNHRVHRSGPRSVLRLRYEPERGQILRTHLRHFYSLRAGQDAQQDTHRDAALPWRDHGDFLDPRFGADSAGRARRHRADFVPGSNRFRKCDVSLCEQRGQTPCEI